MTAPILVIVRESPLAHRTARLLDSLAAQEPAGLAETVILRLRSTPPVDAAPDHVREVLAEPDWMGQAARLIEASGCRWVALPSSVDRYTAGMFETVAQLGGREEAAVVFGCRVVRQGRSYRIGPNPFRFDYFALRSGFNYLAPAGVFMSARRLAASGGFDPRFPNAATYEYLLRTGAAHGVAACPAPLVETEAEPFPGVPAECAALYAAEAVSAALHYDGFFLAPGTAMGMVAVLAERIASTPYADHHYDERMARLLASAGHRLADRFLEYVGLEEEGPEGDRRGAVPGARARGGAFSDGPLAGSPSTAFQRIAGRVRAMSPRPVWNTLRRAKRAWRAFRDPLYG